MKLMRSTLISIAFSLFSNLAFAHTNIGIFDLNRALFATDAWQTRLESLEQDFAEEQATIVELRSELEEIFANIEVNAPTLTETNLQRLKEEGAFRQLRIQQIGERVQTSLRESQNAFLEQNRQLLGQAINTVYEEGSYDFILRSESVVVSGFTLDVTPAVTAKLNELIAATSQ